MEVVEAVVEEVKVVKVVAGKEVVEEEEDEEEEGACCLHSLPCCSITVFALFDRQVVVAVRLKSFLSTSSCGSIT